MDIFKSLGQIFSGNPNKNEDVFLDPNSFVTVKANGGSIGHVGSGSFIPASHNPMPFYACSGVVMSLDNRDYDIGFIE
jgi:hypothetical protein